MAVYSYLDLSTSHITKDDADLLDQDADETPYTTKYAEGYYVLVPEYNPEVIDLIVSMTARGYSDDFVNLLLTAHKAGHKLVLLDADADCLEEFPTHAW